MKNHIYTLLIFITGSSFGSFFYTLSLRYTKEKFIKNIANLLCKPSHCPKCEKKIYIIYLIPIIGYLLCCGKCKNCKESISIFYPLSEFFFGMLALIIYYKFGMSVYSLIVFLILSLSITVSLIDIYSMTIPNSLVITFFLFSLYPFISQNTYKESFYGFTFMLSIFILILVIFPGSFGGGDAKYASAIGFLVGFDLSIIVLEVALIIGTFFGITYSILAQKNLKIKIPFAPFLTIGLFTALFFGRDIVLLYYHIVY